MGAANFLKNCLREVGGLFSARASRWRSLRKSFLKKNPECAVCGNTKDLVVHHVVPVHVRPELELDESNLLSLCEGKGFNCHFFFGHLKDWTRHNPDVASDAKIWREKFKIGREKNGDRAV